MINSKLIQVCGLPRSGTGFISVFLSLHPEAISYHELITKSDDYRSVIEESLKRYKYVVDCSTYGYLPQCSYPQSKKIFIRRNPADSRISSQLALGVNIPIEEYVNFSSLASNWMRDYEVLVINFSTLFNVSTLKKIWVYCFDSEEYFSEEKASHFIEMNIQMKNPEKVVKDYMINNRILNQLKEKECQH
jgi:hypothetical protein